MFSNGPVQTTAGIDVIAGQKQQVVYIFKYERFLSGLEKTDVSRIRHETDLYRLFYFFQKSSWRNCTQIGKS